MRFSLSVIFLVALLPTALTSTWKRIGLGRVSHAFSYNSSAIVLTDQGIIARLTLDQGSVIWRSTPPARDVRLLSIHHLPDIQHVPVTVVTTSDQKITAIVSDTGKTLWQISGCAVRTCQKGAVTIEACNGSVKIIDATTGFAATNVKDGHCSSDGLSHSWTADTSEFTSQPRKWMLPTGELESFDDGLLTYSNSDGLVWSREEGLAYISQAVLFTRINSPERSVIVALSDLEVILGLDAMDAGTVLWKSKLKGDCKLIKGHREVAIVVCVHGESTNVLALKLDDGMFLHDESMKGYVAKQAIVEDGCCVDKSHACIRLVDAQGKEKVIATSSDCAMLSSIPNRGWLMFESDGTQIHGLRDGKTAWHVNVPRESRIIAVETGSGLHTSSSRIRPPAVHVTGDRRVLFKHVDPDIVLVLAKNEEKSLIHAMLVDSQTGSVYDVVTHPEAVGPVSTVRGESWFVYSFWSARMLEQEIHVIDMYEPDTEVTRVHHALLKAANSAFGDQLTRALTPQERTGMDQCLSPTAQGSNQTQCTSEHPGALSEAPKNPVILRSSMLTAGRIARLDVTETTLGVAEPSLVITLDSGQVALVSKILMDARRPKARKGFNPAEYLVPYRPTLNLHSASPESKYVNLGEYVVGARHVAIAPAHRRESMCQIAVFGIDILFEKIHPIGTFDALPENFSYSSVVGMIVTLGSALFYTQRLKRKTRLLQSW